VASEESARGSSKKGCRPPIRLADRGLPAITPGFRSYLLLIMPRCLWPSSTVIEEAGSFNGVQDGLSVPFC
jgi:hypothetical protein